MPKTRKKQRGFSLVELAIVFAIIGIVLSGIWTYTGTVNEKSRREQFTKELLNIVDGVRTAYVSQPNISGKRNSLTYSLAKRGIFPTRYVRHDASSPCGAGAASPCKLDGPWGPYDVAGLLAKKGAMGVCSWTMGTGLTECPGGIGPASTDQTFAVELMGIQPDTCIAVTTQNSSSSGPTGLLDVVINTISIMTDAGTTHSLPVQVADAVARCSAGLAADGTATVGFVYRLRVPN